MTAPASPPDWDAIARFLAGESNADEAAVVRGWLEANPRDRDLVERLNAGIAPDGAANTEDIDVEAALARVHRRMADPARPRLTMSRARGPYWLRPLGAAATLAAAAAIVLFVTNERRKPVSTAPPAVAHTYSTGVGQRDSVLLADGSRVVLGSQSRLVVPADFAAARSVELTGDAYFDVRHDAAKPFSVRAAGARIEDIGTIFTVESDAGAMTSVAVIAGNVRLRPESSDPAGGVVLSAGDRGTLSADGQTHVDRNAVRDEDTAWISGRLAFRDAPLSRVAAEIQRWYGVNLRFTDSTMLAQHVTMSFAGEPVEQVLRIVELSIGARLERRGDSAIFSPATNRGPATSR